MAASITGTLTLLDKASGPLKRIERQALKTQAAIEGVGGRLDRLNRQVRSTTRSLEALDVELDRKQRAFRKLEMRLGKAESAFGSTSKAADQHSRALRNVESETTKAGESMDQTGRRSSKLSTELRKLGGAASGIRAVFMALKFPAIIAGFGMLTQVVGALGAAVVALLPRIGDLAGAVGAMPFAFGAAAQGVGVLKLAMMGVGDALKAGIQMHQNAGQSAIEFGNQTRAAAQAVQNAEYQVQMSQRASKDAQIALTQARRDAIRSLTDMKLAAQGSVLAERRAALGLTEARNALMAGQMQGVGGTQLRDLQLSVSEARLGLRQARIDARRQQADTRRGLARGVNRQPGMIQARRAVQDAAHNQGQAIQELANAQRAENQLVRQGTSDQNRYRQALKNLSPQAATFVKHLVGMRGSMKQLRASAGRDLFPGLDKALDRSKRLLPMANRIARQTGGVIGHQVAGVARDVTTPGRRRDIEGIAGVQTRVINDALKGARNLGSALIDFMVAAEPFARWLDHTLLGWTDWVKNAAAAGRQTGAIAGHLSRTRTALQQFGGIVKDVYGALRGTLRAARPLGNELWDSIAGAASRWNQWANSFTGQTAMSQFFTNMHPAIQGLVTLTGDLAKALGRLATDPGTAHFLDQLDQMVPDLESMIRNVRDALGGRMLSALDQVAQLLDNLSGYTGPIGLILTALTNVLSVINTIIETVPGLGTVIAAALSVMMLNRFIGRMKVLAGLWRGLRGGGPTLPNTGTGGGGTGGGGGGGGGFFGGGGRGTRPTGRFGRARGALRRLGGPGLGVAGIVAGGALQGHGGTAGAVGSSALTGLGYGAMIGDVVPGIGTAVGAGIGAALGAGLGWLQHHQQARRNATAQGQANAARVQARGIAPTRSRINTLQRQLAVGQYVPGAGGNINPQTGRPLPRGYTLDAQGFPVRAATRRGYLGGNARRRAQAELGTLRGNVGAMERAQAPELTSQLEGMFGAYQQGNATQRRSGRQAIKEQFVTEFRQMGPAGKQALSQSVGQWIDVLSRGNKSEQRMARSLTRQVKGVWADMGKSIQIVNGQILTGSQQEWTQIQKAISDPVEQAREAVAKGFTDMQKQAIGSLMAMGYSRSRARRIVRLSESTNGDVGAAAGAAASGDRYTKLAATYGARGMRIPGVGTRDTVPVAPGAMAAPGELIVNRHTERRQNAINAMVGAPPLGSIVAGETKRHSEFARGGRLVPGHPELHGGISQAAERVLQAFPGLSISATTNGGHARGSYHYLGEAIDLAAPMNPAGIALMHRAAGWIGRNMPGLTEGIHNPNLSIKNGAHVDPGFWGSAVWAQHANHIHMALAGALAGALVGGTGGGGGAAGVARAVHARLVGGAGMTGGVANAALLAMQAGLNRRINAGGGGGGGGGRPGGPANVRRMVLAGLRLAGVPTTPANVAAQMRLTMGESGGRNVAQAIHDVNSTNGSGGAKGVTQMIQSSFDAYAVPGHRNIWNTIDNEAASARYQMARYGHLVGHSGYAMGGRLPDWGGWNAAGGSFTVHKPTIFGAGENGTETVHIRPRGGGGAGGGNVFHVTVNIDHYHMKGQVKDAIREEMKNLAEDLGMVTVGGDA